VEDIEKWGNEGRGGGKRIYIINDEIFDIYNMCRKLEQRERERERCDE
jgi:hypothetical protein